MTIVELTGADVTTFIDAFIYGPDDQCPRSISVAIDPIDQAVKFKVNNGTWSPPMGRLVDA